VYNPDSLSIAHGNLPLYQRMDHHQIVRENLRAWKPLIFKISRATKKEQLIPNFNNTQATHEHISHIPFFRSSRSHESVVKKCREGKTLPSQNSARYTD
jgi:hypothetical protein